MVRVGVIGGGQLAWMMAGAAEKLGVELVVQTPSPSDPAAGIAKSWVLGAIDDARVTAELATQCDVITFENEFVDLEALQPLADQGVVFRPGLNALAPLLDKYDQRQFLAKIDLPVPEFRLFDWNDRTLKFPLVLKARRHGYDGYGTFIVKDEAGLESLGRNPKLAQASLLLEEFVPFDRELAIMVARSSTGEVMTYPVVETQQEQQVCRRVIAPAAIDPLIAEEVETIAQTLMTELQAVGVFGVELFLTPQGRVLVNEIAPRVHNSGHYTLDTCQTSQFEQHLRAVAGVPLADPGMTSAGAVMVNLLGYEQSTQDYREKRQRLAEIPQAQVYWYGKPESRPGRKLGHVTVALSESELPQATTIAQTLESLWYER